MSLRAAADGANAGSGACAVPPMRYNPSAAARVSSVPVPMWDGAESSRAAVGFCECDPADTSACG